MGFLKILADESLRTENSRLSEEIDTLSHGVRQSLARQVALSQAIEEVTTERDLLRLSLDEQVVQLAEKLRQEKAKTKSLAAEISAIQDHSASQSRQIDAMKDEVTELQSQIRHMTIENETLSSKVTLTELERDTLLNQVYSYLRVRETENRMATMTERAARNAD